MKITAIRCILASAPYALPGDAEREIHLKTGFRSAAFIRVDTDEGVSGLGETYAGVFAPETARELVAQFALDLIGHDPMEPVGLWERMRHASYYWGRVGISQSVLGGIEMALWDLKGKALDKPVWELLGGRAPEALPVYASGGNDKPFVALGRELQGYVQEGYGAVKIRINNLSLDQIVTKVSFAREALGPGIGLAVDAVQGTARKPWSTREALEVAKALEPFNLEWIEEPAEVTNYAGYADIRRETTIPVAGGESVTSVLEADAYLRAGALDLFQPDASIMGGISVFRQVARMCEQRSVRVAAHAWCGGIGIMGNYHAAFASPNCAWLELPNVPNPLRDAVLVEPLSRVDGRLPAPSAPGLGVRLPNDFEERYPYRPGSFYRILG